MFRGTLRISRPVIVCALVASLTAAAAVAGTVHTFAAVQTTGSEGAYDFLQTSVGGALQGETGPAASTGLGTPFGVFGKYGPPSGTTTVGLGVVGISTLGWGVTGESLNGYPALYAFPNKRDGVGLDAESDTSEAIYGEAHGSGDGADLTADGSGSGLSAVSETGSGIFAEGGGDGVAAFGDNGSDGVYGQSTGGYGVEATSVHSDGVYAGISNGSSGVHGVNFGSGVGVTGEANTGYGVGAFSEATPGPAPTGPNYQYAATYSQSQSGPGVYGVSAHASGTAVDSSSAYNRYTGVSGYASDGAGVYGYSTYDIGMLAENGGKNPTLVVEHDTPDDKVYDQYEIVAGNGGVTAADGFNVNFAVDTTGYIYATGSSINGSSMAITQNPRSDTLTYGAESTEPMVEDVGTAQLVNGAATVAIAGDFRQTIQDPSRYVVFLTPEGDSNGLYVTQKSAAGFVVRESRGGRSTLTFDYRIVAQRYGVRTGRLPHLAAISPQMARLHFASLHRNGVSMANASTPLASTFVGSQPRKGSKRAALLAQARYASAAAHRRMTRPPAPPPGFLAGINR